jgi:hypothetical protein
MSKVKIAASIGGIMGTLVLGVLSNRLDRALDSWLISKPAIPIYIADYVNEYIPYYTNKHISNYRK